MLDCPRILYSIHIHFVIYYTRLNFIKLYLEKNDANCRAWFRQLSTSETNWKRRRYWCKHSATTKNGGHRTLSWFWWATHLVLVQLPFLPSSFARTIPHCSALHIHLQEDPWGSKGLWNVNMEVSRIEYWEMKIILRTYLSFHQCVKYMKWWQNSPSLFYW